MGRAVSDEAPGSDRAPVSEAELRNAVACRLIEPDGTRWEVMDVTFDAGRAWVRARCRNGADSSGGAPGSNGSGAARAHGNGKGRERPALRIFDTLLTAGGRLVWHLPGGRRVSVRGSHQGEFQWTIEGPRGEPELSAQFFEDPFLES